MRLRSTLLGFALLVTTRQATAQGQTQPPAPPAGAQPPAAAPAPAPPAAPTPPAAAPAPEERSTGLPKKVNWTFNFDAGGGMFGFGNSLYRDRIPDDPSGDLGGNWFESYAKPALSGSFENAHGEWFAKVSAVGERTFDTPPVPLVGSAQSSFKVEDMYIGWRSRKTLPSLGENALEFSLGREQYKIGHGFLLWDGSAEGGSRGGFWSNARKAWGFAGLGKLHAKNNTVELFYLDRDELPENNSNTKVAGANYEFVLDTATTIGASYMHFMANLDGANNPLPARDGMNVYNLRLYSAPLRQLRQLSFEFEWARENNGDLIQATAWTAQAAFEFSKVKWTPKLSYRYAFFKGDDPATPANEAFDPLLPGFYDWGTWWQGEIGGEYFLSNSNLVSHQARLHLTPFESLSGGLIGYSFKLDQLPAGVTSKNLLSEIDLYADWKVNSNFIVSFVAAVAHPQDAATQAYGRTSNFTYGMIYVAYAY